MKMTRLLQHVLTSSLLFVTTTVFALQIVEPVEGHNSFVKISAKEMTRISVENGKLRQIIYTDGELIMEKDEGRGQAFIRPVVRDKPINVRVITAPGRTYSLILQPVDIPQEDVVIRDLAGQADIRKSENKDETYTKAITTLIQSMASDVPPAYLQVKQVNKEFALWEGTQFRLISTYADRAMLGEKYKLTNIGATKIRLTEQELYRAGVMAVAIESLTLDPGQATSIYVVVGVQ